MKNVITLLMLFLIPFAVNAQIVVSNDITSNTTWSAANEYILDGLIFVDSTATLTIEAGTVIKGRIQANITTGDGASALIVRRGATLLAEGTFESPIIFTSELDDLSIPDDLTEQDRGLWGGLILLGSATTNQPTTDNQIEGIPPTENALYGGNDDSDFSGILKYVSIRHGGFSISGIPGDEINGLTLGAVGNKTVIEHVEVFANLDDGYEWFGGTVNCKWLVAAFCGDDAFDWDQGFRGNGQFWFAVQATDEAGRGGEFDGGDDCETCTPYSIPVLSNCTWIGAGAGTVGIGGDGNDRAFYFRDNSGGKIYNSIIYDFVASNSGVTVEDLASGDDSRVRLESGELVLANNYWYEFSNGNTLSSIATQDFVQTHLTANNNTIADPELISISRNPDGNLDPRPMPGAPTVSGAVSMSDPFFTNVSYIGAFDPADGIWTEGWTALSAYGFTPPTTVDVNEGHATTFPSDYILNQNFPNPFNPSTTISFQIPEQAQIKLSIFNSLGEQIAILLNEFMPAGNYQISWDAADLPSGIYIYRLQAGSKILSNKMLLLR
ncbi:MAG: hypothetical protein Kow0098_08270 [Ignavibacteriaceae bacterium]